jgi:cytochrome c5
VNPPSLLARWRRFAAVALAAAILSAAPAAHDHSLFENERSAPEAVTTHNPLSRASHWHVVRGFLRPETCLACHAQRSAALPALSQALGKSPRAAAAELPTQVDPAHRPLDANPSRGPPSLL